jgi:hypothetical protein
LSRAGFQERKPAIIFLGVTVLLTVIGGAAITFLIAPRQERDRQRIERHPELDASSYADTSIGEFIVITGQLQNNRTMTRHELVAYRVDEWDVISDGDDGYQGSWHTVEANVPSLSLAVNGGVISTAAVATVAMGGRVHEFIEPAESGWQALYAGDSLTDGSLRTQGFRNRDVVTVVGRKTATGELLPDRLYAGGRDDLVRDLGLNVRVLRIVGIAIIASGALLLALFFWLRAK